MDFLRRAALWAAGGLVSAGWAAALWAACLHLPERTLLQNALLAVQAPGAAVSLAVGPAPRPVPRPTPAAVQTSEPTPPPTASASTPAPTATPSPTPTPAPTGTAPELEDAGAIRAEQFPHGRGEGSITLAAGSIRNQTDHPDADLRAAVTTGQLPFAVEFNSPDPQVLILHTHATETYQTWPDPVYDRSFSARTRTTSLNMCAVGARMAQVLNAAGLNTLHDETLHDAPSYTESYARSRATAQEYLRQYPSIKVILDVHRDAIEDADGTRVKPVCTIDGESTAQVMIIAGCDNGTTVSLPNWRLNLRFAAAWEEAMESRFPGLTRPVLCGYRYYNQDLATGCLLIEIGGHANTLQEALRAGEFAAEALADALRP